jgi:opacity protein-like surface antigen
MTIRSVQGADHDSPSRRTPPRLITERRAKIAAVAVEQDGDTEVSTTTFTATPGTPTSPSTTSRAGTATRYGWTAGGGFEYAFDKHWSGFVEYDHLGFLSQIINFTTVTVPALPAGAGAATTIRLVGLNIDRVVAGADYRF